MLKNEKRINIILVIAWATALLLGIITAVWQGGNSLLPEATPDGNTAVKCGVAALLAVNLLLMLQIVLLALVYRRLIKPQLYQGVGLAFFALSLLAECWLSSVFFQNSAIAASMAVEILCLAFIPFVIFIADSTQLPPLPKIIVCGLVLANFLTQNILAIAGVFSLGSLPWLTHAANAVCLLLGAYAITREQNGNRSHHNMLAISTLIFTSCYVLEIIANNNHNLIVLTGLALFSAITLTQMMKIAANALAEEAQTQQLTDLAMVDYQTGFNSRLAFNNYYYNLDEHHNGIITLSVMVIDLNNLKETNDRYGHTAGDELILGAVECIKETFGDTASFFRTGGDEFAIVAVGNEVNMETAMTRLDSQVIHYNANHVHQLSMARGICIDETAVNDMKKLHIIYKAAEDRMYSDKIDNHEQIKVQMIQETYLKKQMLQEQMIREKQFQEQMQRVAEAKHAEDMKKYLAKQMAENHGNDINDLDNINEDIADISNDSPAAETQSHQETPQQAENPQSPEIPQPFETPEPSETSDTPEIPDDMQDMRDQDFNPIFPPIDDSIFWGDKKERKERKERGSKEKSQPQAAAENIPPFNPFQTAAEHKPTDNPFQTATEYEPMENPFRQATENIIPDITITPIPDSKPKGFAAAYRQAKDHLPSFKRSTAETPITEKPTEEEPIKESPAEAEQPAVVEPIEGPLTKVEQPAAVEPIEEPPAKAEQPAVEPIEEPPAKAEQPAAEPIEDIPTPPQPEIKQEKAAAPVLSLRPQQTPEAMQEDEPIMAFIKTAAAERLQENQQNNDKNLNN